jgi:hypothetical protein
MVARKINFKKSKKIRKHSFQKIIKNEVARLNMDTGSKLILSNHRIDLVFFV